MPRGKNCGCICPSCKTPLIARQGNVNEWHFAHASRSVYGKTEHECEFSFYVSVRMMARQLIGETLEILLPKYEGVVVKELPWKKYARLAFLVTKSQTIFMHDVEVETNYKHVSVDVVGQVKEVPFVIYFTHPGRSVPHELYELESLKCGVISVSLEDVPNMFLEAKTSSRSYHNLLSDFLVNDTESKSWVYHPRYKACEQKAIEDLEKHEVSPAETMGPEDDSSRFDAFFSNDASGLSTESLKQEPKRLAEYECVMCHTLWKGWEPGASACPKCNTHLYRTVKRYLRNET